MTAAIIGLIGIVVGALLAGAFTIVVDRRREHVLAVAGGKLIVVELTVAEEKMRSPLSYEPPRGWWIGDLPMDSWRGHQGDIVTQLRPELVEMLARAYATCSALNDEHAVARSNTRISSTGAINPPRGDLLKRCGELATARHDLENDPLLKVLKPRQRVVRWSVALVIPIAVVVFAAIALFAPRAEVNSATVASAIQTELGHGALVECNQNGPNWACTAFPNSSSTPCPVELAHALRVYGVADNSMLQLAHVNPTCSTTSEPVVFSANVTHGEVDAAIAEQTANGERIEQLHAKLATKSAWDTIRNWFWG